MKAIVFAKRVGNPDVDSSNQTTAMCIAVARIPITPNRNATTNSPKILELLSKFFVESTGKFINAFQPSKKQSTQLRD